MQNGILRHAIKVPINKRQTRELTEVCTYHKGRRANNQHGPLSNLLLGAVLDCAGL